MDSSDSTDDVSLPERLTLHEAATVLERLNNELTQLPRPSVALNASGLKVFDSSAVAVLLELRRRLMLQGKSLAVVGRPERLADLVSLYGVSELLPG